MNNQLQKTVLTQITRNFDKITRSTEPQNNKLRSKSVGLQKIKPDQENSIARLKRYDKLHQGTKENHRISMEDTFQKRSKLEIEHYLGKQKRTSQSRNLLLDVCEISLKQNMIRQSTENNVSMQKKQYYLQKNQYKNVNNEFIEPILKSIKSAARNQNRFVYLDPNGKVHFSQQKRDYNHQYASQINYFFQSKSCVIASVFCTPYSVFFIDNFDQLYGMGLNDRGQLGVDILGFIDKPLRIDLPFQQGRTINVSSESVRNKRLEISQKVTKIGGGPFHSVILTSSYKAYYSGTVYGQEELMNDEMVNNFREIKIKGQTIKDIECGLTSVVFQTESNRVYVMGLFEDDNFYSTPTHIEFQFKSSIRQIATANNCIYVISQGLLHRIDMKKKMSIITEIKPQQLLQNKSSNNKIRQCSIQAIHCSYNKTIFVVKQNVSKNKFNYKYCIQTSQHQMKNAKFTQQIHLPHFKQTPPIKIFISNHHLYCIQYSEVMAQIFKQVKSQINHQQTHDQMHSYLDKIKQLEEQNKKLKKQNSLLIKDKNQTPIKQQKFSLSNINYNFQKQITPRTFNHDLQIDFSQIKLTKKIAQGGYGIIYKGIWKKTEVAVKIFKIDQNNTNSVKQFISECRAMEALRHPNIVMFLGACMKRPNFAIVLEYCEGGTLWSLLQNHKIELPWKDRIQLALQTAKAMNYLHDRKNPIVHRDLKSLNVLLDGSRKVKLADFGWTKCLENYMTSKIGTYQWMAPQVMTGQTYSEKVDVFSFSIILWQIASREPPYRNINGIQVAYDVANKQFRPSIPPETPAYFEKLIVQCWQKDPQRRPSFKEVIDILEKQLKSSI